MKNVGVITITNGANYGNRLQNFAVEQVLKDLGFNPITIRNYSGHENIPVYYFKEFLKKTIFKKKYSFYYDKKSVFDCFDKNFINLSNYYVTNNFISKKLFNKIDYFVCGSDQIWNLNFPENNKANFLGIVNGKKKISFSASFGISELPLHYDNRVSEWLNDLDAISVREDAGKNLVYQLCKKDAEVLVDPTLLLSCEQWLKIEKKPTMFNNKKYILCYFLGKIDSEVRDIIGKISKMYNYEIINIMDSNSKFYNVSPNEFIFLERHAEIICTDSFHSTVFAIIFKRPFIVFNRSQNGIMNMNSRIDTLLSKFDLENYKYDKNKNIDFFFKNDFIGVDDLLIVEKEKAISFLKNNLKD